MWQIKIAAEESATLELEQAQRGKALTWIGTSDRQVEHRRLSCSVLVQKFQGGTFDMLSAALQICSSCSCEHTQMSRSVKRQDACAGLDVMLILPLHTIPSSTKDCLM